MEQLRIGYHHSAKNTKHKNHSLNWFLDVCGVAFVVANNSSSIARGMNILYTEINIFYNSNLLDFLLLYQKYQPPTGQFVSAICSSCKLLTTGCGRFNTATHVQCLSKIFTKDMSSLARVTIILLNTWLGLAYSRLKLF